VKWSEVKERKEKQVDPQELVLRAGAFIPRREGRVAMRVRDWQNAVTKWGKNAAFSRARASMLAVASCFGPLKSTF